MLPVIFFDWDGTLADSMPICIEECRMALRTMGLPELPEEVLRRCNGPTNDEGCDILGVPEAMKQAFVKARQAAGLSVVPTLQRTFPGIRELLSDLKGKAELVIVSNGPQEYLDKSLRTLRMEDVFTRVQGYMAGKSKAELLAGLLREMRPERAIMVGDRLGDILSGKANGLTTVAACFGYGNDAEYSQADLRAETVEELLRVLEKWLEEA